MVGKRQSSTTFIQLGKHLERQWLTLTSILIQPSPKRLRMPLVMKRSAFLVAMDRPVVSRTVRCRCFSSSFFPSVPHTRPTHVSRMVMLRYLSIRSKDDQGFFVDDEIFESEKPPSHNNINTGSSSRALRVSSSHVDNKLEMQRTGPIPSNQKPFAEQIHRPELQATIFVPGTVGSLPNLLAIVREAERRYGPITEYRCPTVVRSKAQLS